MRRNQRFWTVTGLGWVLALALVASAAQAGPIVVPPRPGQVGLGVSGMYGGLAKSGDFGDFFNTGPGLAVRLRYRMRYERAFGLTFEAHQLDARTGVTFKNAAGTDTIMVGAPYEPKRLDLDLYGLDFYQLFGTRTKTTRMVSVGAGLARASRALQDGETDFPEGDGFYVSAGAGVERFFWQGVAWDLGARYQAIFHQGSTNHEIQVSLGLIFYATI